MEHLVHPHACGENEDHRLSQAKAVWYTPTRVGKTGDLRQVAALQNGTPPRVWGKRSTLGTVRTSQRYTPTRVGKTSVVMTWVILPKRYTPTRVGKTDGPVRSMRAGPGTPPRVWGKHTKMTNNR